jgi:FKBP-type peptidyl-prolyl cis-trans isomerase FklB
MAGLVVWAAVAWGEEAKPMATPREKAGYAVGLDMGRNLKRMGADLDVERMADGLRDAFAGKNPALTEEEMRATLNVFQNELRQKQMEARKTTLEANLKEGEAFLAANKAKEGVVTLPSGLQYKIITAGTGPKPTEKDTVECHYRGTLLDGTEFDSSQKTGKPATFKLTGVIAGWREALQLMPVGSKWQLFVPAALAYGERGTGRGIGPNAALIFEVELLAIKPGQ